MSHYLSWHSGWWVTTMVDLCWGTHWDS